MDQYHAPFSFARLGKLSRLKRLLSVPTLRQFQEMRSGGYTGRLQFATLFVPINQSSHLLDGSESSRCLLELKDIRVKVSGTGSRRAFPRKQRQERSPFLRLVSADERKYHWQWRNNLQAGDAHRPVSSCKRVEQHVV